MIVLQIVMVLLVVLAAILAAKLPRKLAIQAAYARMHEDRFHAAAERLVMAEDTDVVALKMLRLMNRTIVMKRLLWRVIVDTAFARIRDHRRNSNDFVRQVMSLLDHISATKNRDCAIAVTSFVLTLTYRQLFLGTFVRRFMLFGIHQPHIDFEVEPSKVDYDELYARLNTEPEWVEALDQGPQRSVATFVAEVAVYADRLAEAGGEQLAA